MAGATLDYVPSDPLMREDAWKTANGAVVPITEMGDRHIENVIRFLRRRARALHRVAVDELACAILGPMGPRSDIAEYMAEGELDELTWMDPRVWLEDTPLVRALKAELVIRHEPFGVTL